jgi:hypothetical protein
MAEEHVVGYTNTYTSVRCYSERFDILEGCCEHFEYWFTHTGNTKYRSFNSCSSEERNGINLIRRGGLSLVLRLLDNRGSVTEDHLKFCPFCGGEIKLECTKSVNLEPKTKQVPDGYEEILKWQEPDEATRIKEEVTKQPQTVTRRRKALFVPRAYLPYLRQVNRQAGNRHYLHN